jgi:hypothetical protein
MIRKSDGVAIMAIAIPSLLLECTIDNSIVNLIILFFVALIDVVAIFCKGTTWPAFMLYHMSPPMANTAQTG